MVPICLCLVGTQDSVGKIVPQIADSPRHHTSVRATPQYLSRAIMYSGMGLAGATLLFGFQGSLGFLNPGLPSAAPAMSRHRYSTKVAMAANDQLPANAKRYYVRPDRILDVVTSAPQLLLRLGSGALVDGYRCKCVVWLDTYVDPMALGYACHWGSRNLPLFQNLVLT